MMNMHLELMSDFESFGKENKIEKSFLKTKTFNFLL